MTQEPIGKLPDKLTRNGQDEEYHYIFLHSVFMDCPQFVPNATVFLLIGKALEAALKRDGLQVDIGGSLVGTLVLFSCKVQQLQPALDRIKELVFDLLLHMNTEIAFLDWREMVVRTYHTPFAHPVIADWPMFKDIKPGPLGDE